MTTTPISRILQRGSRSAMATSRPSPRVGNLLMSVFVILLASNILGIGYASPVPATSFVPSDGAILPNEVAKSGFESLQRRILANKLQDLTNSNEYELLGFTTTGQLVGSTNDGNDLPLESLHRTHAGDLMLLRNANIKFWNDASWKCFVVASRTKWTGTMPDMIYNVDNNPHELLPEQSYEDPNPAPPVYSEGTNIILQKQDKQERMIIPGNLVARLQEKLEIKSMCVNPLGSKKKILFRHKDPFAGNTFLESGAQWQSWKSHIKNCPENLV
ncbi:hypothetical protein J3R30DRAFT_3734315 [Lentinula aciculospora]|uniref:Uncharacterized protein n=1 Tax=Lentinula aciculospora TaxID=153920 RepID=A0A9W9AAB4_9AGAR|nr:hypothetical protein J3R30DRAFT_3734315 [Lentinula aciculospora]